ncbi:MAG: hypothetical protein KU38_06110 [Sulfurovum sp. FS08-3]|nr:MAG: hypothetical protein KU38_06110 [Sulfurovum sp. FS08-3]
MKLTFKSILALLFVILLSGCVHQPSVGHDGVLSALQKYDPQLKREHFVSSAVDLNDDECQDAVVLMNRKSRYCGKRGCVMLVLLCQEGELAPIAKTTHVNPVVSTSRNKTLGLKNIDVVVYPEGESPHQVSLHYNGKSYPMSALFGYKIEKRTLERVLFK